jgi:chromosome segregation ATPase
MNSKKLINDIFNINTEQNNVKGILKQGKAKPKRLEVSFAKKMINEEEKLRLKHSLEFANSRIKNLKAFIEQMRSTECGKARNDKTELKGLQAHSKGLKAHSNVLEESLDESQQEILRLQRQISYNQELKPKLDEANDEIKELKAELRYLKEENKELERDKRNYVREALELRKDSYTASNESLNAQRELMELKDKLPQCSVCLEDIFTIKEDDSRSILITQCGHLICSKDLAEWADLNAQEVCPAGCGSKLQYTTKLHI